MEENSKIDFKNLRGRGRGGLKHVPSVEIERGFMRPIAIHDAGTLLRDDIDKHMNCNHASNCFHSYKVFIIPYIYMQIEGRPRISSRESQS